MNLYFLIEGKRTERKVYPAWISHLVPALKQVHSFDCVVSNNYYVFSGEGYPRLLGRQLVNAVNDYNKIGTYDCFVVCLDADEASVEERRKEVLESFTKNDLKLASGYIHVIVQNRCIETWFLGNKKVVSRFIENQRLKEFMEFYDVSKEDPELMGVYPDFLLHSPFHSSYLKEVFKEKSINYSKVRPGHVCDVSYLEQLIKRIDEFPQHLRSFAEFVIFCNKIKEEIAK